MTTAVQLFRQAEPLKAAVSDSTNSISETWVTRQKLEDVYKSLLLLDLEYALDKKVEQDLWNHAFKNHINKLQAQTKDKQNSKRAEIQASLNLFLETASGFYLQLIQIICSTFKLDLPFRRKSSVYGVISEKCSLKTKVNQPKKSSCWYICQHCLVHLGDIARYRHQVEQAQTYYWHAANLVPYNGQPYNQLAILEAARGNKLSTVFYHIRSLAVRHPFPVAATNLEKFYTKILRDVGEFKEKLSLTEVLTAFLQFHAHVHMFSDLDRAASLVDKLLSSLPAHVTSQSFHTHVLIQIIGINLFAMQHAKQKQDSANDSDSNNSEDELTQDEQRCYNLVFTLTISLLDVLLQYTPKLEQKVKEFFTLPAIKVLFDWLLLNKDSFQQEIVKTSGLWGNLSKLLNTLYLVICSKDEKKKVDTSKYDNLPLPEDQELRSFQPIEKSHSGYSFSKVPSDGLASDIEIQLRCKRLVDLGKKIADDFHSLSLITYTTNKMGKFQFSSQLNPKRHITLSTTPVIINPEKKTPRQNVAIQAIIQKQNQTNKPKEKESVKAEHTGTEWSNTDNTQKTTSTSILMPGRQSSPKYLLAVPMSNPQFMKSGTNQLPPNPSPRHRAQIAAQQKQQSDRNPSPVLLNPTDHPRGVRPNSNINRMEEMPTAPTAPQTMRYPPPNMNPASVMGAPNFSTRPPYPFVPFQGERLPPYQAQFPQLNGSGDNQPFFNGNIDQKPSVPPPAASGQFGSNQNASTPPKMGSGNPNILPPFVPPMISNINLNQPPPPTPATPIMNGQYGADMQYPQSSERSPQNSLPQQQGYSQQTAAYKSPPKMTTAQFYQTNQKGSDTQPGYPYSRMMGMQGLMPNQNSLGTSNAPILNPGQVRGQVPGMRHDDPQVGQQGDPLSCMSQLTIQPPKPSVSEMSKLSPLTSSFLGHAEGTPKPENFNRTNPSPIGPPINDYPELKFISGFMDAQGGNMSRQQGTYSLFSSSSPWTVQISSTSETKGTSSSPFSSQPSSMRNSPDQLSRSIQSSSSLRFIPPPQGEEWSGPPPSMTEDVSNNAETYGDANAESIWTSNGPSPLEKLLELQRQRQNDPH